MTMSAFQQINKDGTRLLDEDKHQEACLHYKHALDNLNAIPDISASEIGQLWNNYGLACRFLNQKKEAQSAYETALNTFKDCKQPPVHEIVVTLSNLGRLALANKDNDLAWSYLIEELELRKSQLAVSPQDVDVSAVAWCLHNLAEVLCRRREFDKALKNLHQALSLRQQSLPPEHDNIAENIKMLADVYWTIGDNRKAKKYYELSLPMHKRILGCEHWMTIDIETQLRKLEKVDSEYRSISSLFIRKANHFLHLILRPAGGARNVENNVGHKK